MTMIRLLAAGPLNINSWMLIQRLSIIPVLVIPPVNSLESDWGTEDWGGRLIHFRQSLALVGVRMRGDWSGNSVVWVGDSLKLYLDDKSITDTIPVFQTWIGYENPKSIHREDHGDNI